MYGLSWEVLMFDDFIYDFSWEVLKFIISTCHFIIFFEHLTKNVVILHCVLKGMGAKYYEMDE